MICEESRLNLAHQNLKNVPKTLVNSFQGRVKIIDISNNNITDVSFLKSFTQLTSIILDHNEITSDAEFPVLPEVSILWLNNNRLEELSDFIRRLSWSFPQLRQLSLMGNPGVPECHEETYYHYLRYRLYVISCFQCLQHLDDRPVTDHEKEEAIRHFGSPLLNKFATMSVSEIFLGAMNKVRQYMAPPPRPTDRPNLI